MDKDSEVKLYYDNYSTHYDSFYKTIQFAKYNYLMNYIQLNEWICDLGGGTGLLSEWINYPVLTLDISKNMLKIGQKNRHLLPLAGDLQFLPIRSNSISTFISFTALQNANNPVKALKEILRISSSKSEGVITFLKKAKYSKKLREFIQERSLNLKEKQISGEDYCFVSSKLSSLGS